MDRSEPLMWWLLPFLTAAEFTLTMMGAEPERQLKAKALRRQFRVIEGGKRA